MNLSNPISSRKKNVPHAGNIQSTDGSPGSIPGKASEKSRAVWIVAHRGAQREAPENTAAAFDAALAYPIDGVELDVQLSLDGVPVLYHNASLTKVKGGRKRISEMTFAELSRFDWGGWFSEAFVGEPILSLERTLKRYGQRTRLLIEIKSYQRERASGISRELTLQVADLLHRTVPARYLKHLFILSFDPEVLHFAADAGHGGNLVLNLKQPLSLNGPRWAVLRHLYAFCLPVSKLTAEFVMAVHEREQKIMTYSCNTPAQVKKSLALGVDVIMTDDPGWLVKYLKITRLDP